MNLIKRAAYLDALRRQLHTPDVKVLVGVRRSGKSCVLKMFADSLVNAGTPRANIFYKRFDSFDIPLDYEVNRLYQDISSAIRQANPHEWFYVCLDEIQDVQGWEQVVRRLHTRELTDVYITGSNAKVLSGELATYLTGRYIEIPVYPLSFGEYRSFSEARHANASFSDYLRFGGMPGLFSLNIIDEQGVGQELQTILESILFRDVASRMEVRNLPALERVARFLLATCGNLFSLNSVVNTLKTSGIHIDPKTADSFIRGMRESFLIYESEQCGIQGKQILRPQRKFYPVDLGFKSIVSGFGTVDMGARIEAVVYLELLRRGYSVSVGAMANSEIDFVAQRLDERMYVQVTQSLLDGKTRDRELEPLRKLTDAFPRLVLTADSITTGVTEEGIRIKNIEEWLLDQK